MKARLYQAELHYPGLTLYTAASGSVTALHSLFLHLQDGEWDAIGEVRINIAYLNGYAAERVRDNVIDSLRHWDLSQPAATLLAQLEQRQASMLAPTRMLLDMALHDLLAKQAGVSVAGLLGDKRTGACAMPTNQTLFWGDDAMLLRQSSEYVERGFRDLKLRVGIGRFDDDLRRLALLREHYGDDIELAIDVNGQWTPEQAKTHLSALAPFHLRYVEQPIGHSAIDALPTLAAASPIPLMLDESVSCEADIERILSLKGLVWAHLKLVKLGGIGPTVSAARRLRAAGVPFMIGQMNEGSAATAAALQVAWLTQPQFTELYGADGLGDDPVSGLRYQAGSVQSLSLPGLGVVFHPERAHFIQEF